MARTHAEQTGMTGKHVWLWAIFSIGALVFLLGIGMTMYAFLAPMEDPTAYFGKDSYAGCSFCKDSDDKKARDPKSENEVKRKLQTVGPIFLGVGILIIVPGFIYSAANGGLMAGMCYQGMLFNMNRNIQRNIIRKASRYPLQANPNLLMMELGNVQYCGTYNRSPRVIIRLVN